MSSNRKHKRQAEKLTFRLSPRYAAKVLEVADAANVSPNQLGRLATMLVADNGLLRMSNSMGVVEETLIRFKKDFNDAVAAEEREQTI